MSPMCSATPSHADDSIARENMSPKCLRSYFRTDTINMYIYPDRAQKKEGLIPHVYRSSPSPKKARYTCSLADLKV